MEGTPSTTQVEPYTHIAIEKEVEWNSSRDVAFLKAVKSFLKKESGSRISYST